MKVQGIAPEATRSPEQQRLAKTAREFEAFFIETLLRQARTARSSGGSEGLSIERETNQSMMEQHMARAIAERGGLGLADQLYRGMTR